MATDRNVAIVDETGKVLYKPTCKAIASCSSLPEIISLRAKIKAFEEYSKVLGQSHLVTKLRLRAERKIGEFTKEIPAVVGIEPLRSVKEYPDDTLSERVTKEQILRDNKISKVQASKWERIAGIPSIDFEFEITKDDVSTEHLLTYAKDPNKANEKRKQKQTRKREQKQTQTAKDKARTFNFQERVRMAEEHTVKLKQKPKPKFTEQPGFGQRAEWYQLMSRLATALEKVVGVVSKQEDIVTELLMTGRLLGMKSSRGLDHELKRIHKCLDKLRPLFSVMKKLEDEDDADNFKGDTIDGEVIH